MKNKLIRTNIIIATLSGLIFFACRHNENPYKTLQSEQEPTTKDGGKWIEFSDKSKKLDLFVTADIQKRKNAISFFAPATVIGRVHKTSGEGTHTIILFESSEITSVYSSYLQNQTLLNATSINFHRVSELYKSGAVTGKELNDVSAELMNIQTALSEDEAKLRETGLNPENLNNAAVGTVWLICDLPESELDILKKGQKYKLDFPSFPEESFTANIDVIAEVMNTQSRKIKIRMSLMDTEEKIRPGMYAKVKFEMQHNGIMIPKKAVFSANARYYVYIKHEPNIFELREVTISTETPDLIEISGGVTENEKVVIQNVYLLKGISLGI